MGYWAEIRNNYFESGSDVDRNLEGDVLATISIDAWKTMDDNEEGRVIVRVLLSNHGDILVDYHDNVARVDTAAQEAIAEAKKELEAYYRESVIGRAEKEPEPERSVFCLCEEFEGTDGIREFQILAVSAHKAALRQMMEDKINADEYGMIKNNGIAVLDEDHFLTEFDCGFVEYYISERKVLSREEIGLMLMDEPMSLPEDITKHISEIKKGDRLLHDGFAYTATSDAYMVKTDLGREWNVEVVSESGPESYLYASYFPDGLVSMTSVKQPALSEQIGNAEAARSSCSQVLGNVIIDNQR